MNKLVYFIGIGGIGMSALARYFKYNGAKVSGYDRVSTPLTQELESEGMSVHYCDDIAMIEKEFFDKDKTLVIYTPAIPKDHRELLFFKENGFNLVKRSAILGVISKGKYLMAVAGTHGKTSTTTMLAYFNSIAADDGDGVIGGGSAFMGGISKNFGTNMVIGNGKRIAAEADEFDRSFLQLYPDVAVITSTDADHLDIYGTHAKMKEAFTEFTSQINDKGALIYKHGTDLTVGKEGISIYRYSYDNKNADFYATNISSNDDGCYNFDIVTPDRIIANCHLGIPGAINVENAIAAVALMWISGFNEDKLRQAMSDFRGVKRRFDFYINTPEKIYMDDYAHHPQELHSAITSVRKMFPSKSITAIFQPHLYTRTRDFADGFAESLSLVDRLILLPIYPARELPIDGVTSEMILSKVTVKEAVVVQKEELLNVVANDRSDILITFGAGDIDAFCQPIYDLLKQR